MNCSRGLFDFDFAVRRLEELRLLSEDSALWSSPDQAKKILKEKDFLEGKISCIKRIECSSSDDLELARIAFEQNDTLSLSQLENSLNLLSVEAEKLEVACLFSGDHDLCNCFVDINAGAGGTESHDWASMMMRMYMRFAERLGFKSEIIHEVQGEEAGIKSCTIKVLGSQAYGWFRTESGVHRLVRISPFNAAGKRMTSFASCWIYPEPNGEEEIVIEDKDLRVDTYRSSGAGGQHVNTTDSAVRITHLPTGVVAQCQSDRSQHKNRAEAMKMLKAKLYELQDKAKNAEIDAQNAAKSENGWGHQIRSYVLQPYQMVKDLRTSYETSNTQAVLDGDLEGFVSASLAAQVK